MDNSDQPVPLEIENLQHKLSEAKLPDDLRSKAQEMVDRVARIAKMGGNFAAEYDNVSRYVDWTINLPWYTRSQDAIDLKESRAAFDRNHYGLQYVKDKILEYLAVLQLETAKLKELEASGQTSSSVRKLNRAPILLLVGLVGTGKTTIAASIAEAMGRKFVRIPFGGMGDSIVLRGQSRVYPDAQPGAIMKGLRSAGTKNPVILLDEVDRVDEEARISIMGTLVELLDPEQNSKYVDHYIDYPFDLSEVLFVATSNNTSHISTAVLDRLEPIRFPSYTDEEKLVIARDYVLPRILKESGLNKDTITIDETLWPKIVRPTGFDSGIRTLERTLSGLVRRVAMMIVSGEVEKVAITPDNIKKYLPPTLGV